MGFQGTYSVYGLDFHKTYEKLNEFGGEDISSFDVVKGNITFWLKINSERARVQISNKGNVNIWHARRECIDRTLKRLKTHVVNAKGEKCKDWAITKMQRIGAIPIATPLAEEIDLSTTIEEADHDEVLGHLQELKQEKDPDILAFRLKKLDTLAPQKRIAHLPEMLSFIEKALKEPKYHNKKVLAQLIGLVNTMINIEKIHKFPNYQEIIRRIQGATLQSIVRILENETDYHVLYQIISFLKNSDREESVDVLFKMVERLSDDLYKRLKQLVFEVLFRADSTLKHAQEERINRSIGKLLKSPNTKIKARGREISERAY